MFSGTQDILECHICESHADAMRYPRVSQMALICLDKYTYFYCKCQHLNA